LEEFSLTELWRLRLLNTTDCGTFSSVMLLFCFENEGCAPILLVWVMLASVSAFETELGTILSNSASMENESHFINGCSMASLKD
jgi:hypothetical protein